MALLSHYRATAVAAANVVFLLGQAAHAQVAQASQPWAPVPVVVQQPAQPQLMQQPMAPGAYVAIDPATGRPMAMPSQMRMQPKPDTLPYREGMAAPSGYTLQESHLNGLVVGGIVPLSILYVISLSVASANNFEGPAGWLVAPVVGPFGWLAANKARSNCNGDVCSSSDNSAVRALVMMDGIFQTAGAAMFVAGLAITRKYWVLTDPQQFYVVPYTSSTSHGLMLGGHF